MCVESTSMCTVCPGKSGILLTFEQLALEKVKPLRTFEQLTLEKLNAKFETTEVGALNS